MATRGTSLERASYDDLIARVEENIFHISFGIFHFSFDPPLIRAMINGKCEMKNEKCFSPLQQEGKKRQFSPIA